MKNWLATTALSGAFALVTCFSAQAASDDIDTGDLLNLSLEELTNIEVTSVSKKSEKASEAAAAIYVITQDDIRRSGHHNIPELLRMVPGLHVAQTSSHQWSLSSRGLSGQFADTLLVLIDGRSVYTPLFSGVYWDIQDTPLADVERIEVIRGPGATLWGANAVNGVINIITKNAKDTQGGYASATAGTAINGAGTVRYGMKAAEDAYVRMYAKHDDYNEMKTMAGAVAGDPWSKSQAGFRSDWKNTSSDTFTLQGDVYHADKRVIQNLYQPAGTSIATRNNEDLAGGNVLGRWDRQLASDSNLTLQMYYDVNIRNNIIFDQTIQTMDFDAQHSWTPVEGHEVVWGGGYRHVMSDIKGTSNTALGIPYVQIFPQEQSDGLLSAFVQDKIALVPDEWFLTLGSKFEHNAFSGFEYQPSARLSWIVDDKQTWWGSVSRSVRTPNIGGTNDVQQIGAPVAANTFFIQQGNPDLDSISMVSYELGYRVQPQKNISLDTSVFYNDYDNMIVGVQGTPFVSGAYLFIPVTPENIGSAQTWGVESTAKWNPTSWAELTGSYTLLQMDFNQPDPYGYSFRARSPQHQFNARATFFLPHDVELTTSAYYVDQLAALDLNTSEEVAGYVRFDSRLSWQATEGMELSLVGQNLLDNEHQEYYGFAYQNSSQVPRSVYGNISLKF
jgi:iron complex outermembrane receptor protein